MKIVRVLIVLLLAVGAGTASWYLNRFDNDGVAYYGYVEGEYVRLAVPVSGVLDELMVTRGEHVEASAPLFALDATSAEAQKAQALAALARAEAQLTDLEKGARAEEIEVREAEIAEAQAALANAEIELKRQEDLKGSAALVESRLDSARAVRDQAVARVQALKASLAVARLPARADQVKAAERAVEEARAAVTVAERRLTELAPVSPTAATVEETYYLPGAWVPANAAVVSLLPDNKRKLRFYVPQSEIAKIAPGKEIRFSCDGCAEGLTAKVSYIAPEAEYTPPVIYSAASREKLVFLVEAIPGGGQLLPVGLPVEVQK